METSSVAAAVARALHAALPEAGLTVEQVAELLSPTPNPTLGDLAFPCFRLAKSLRQAPPKIASELAAALEVGELIETASAAGPYVNLRLGLPHAAHLVLGEFARGLPEPSPSRDMRVMVEYSQPNTHKAFHVGHMRNLSLGDALVRLLRAQGYSVVAANYLGDVGAHIARFLWWYLDRLDAEQREPPASHRGEWLGGLYAAASNQIADWTDAAKRGDNDAELELERAKARTTEILLALESRDAELTEIWQKTRQWSLDEFDEIYRWSEVKFDRVYFESEVDEPGLQIVDEYLKKGVFVESEGAVGIVNDEIKHMPFFMLRKRDGTSLYSTKDLALARLKFDEERIGRSIYVVDSRQSDHFRHVFRTLEKMGFEQAELCEHVPYEMVELTDGPMAARKGNMVLFRTLRETMTNYVETNYLAKYRGEWPDDEIGSTSRAVALGAIKYGMLNRDVNQKIVFDLEVWLDLEGNTGPFLQYSCARASSIIRKGIERGKQLSDDVLTDPKANRAACSALAEPEERELVLALASFRRPFEQAATQLRPHIVCTYLHELAKGFNRFHHSCNVIVSEGDQLQGRLLAVHAAREALRWGLARLGIPAPERM